MSEILDEKEKAEEKESVVYAPRDDDGSLANSFVSQIKEALDQKDAEATLAETRDLHEADLADLMEALPSVYRVLLVRAMGKHFDFATLTELDDDDRLEIIEELTVDEVADGFRNLDSDDAVYILEDLEANDQQEILEKLPFIDRLALSRALDYPDESAGRRMKTDLIAVAPFWTVGHTIDYMREATDLPDDFYEIFVVDPTFRLVGTVALDKILRTKRPVRIRDIMIENRILIDANQDQEEAARQFERYDLVSAAVVDESQRLVGVLTIDDIVDVINEEAEEDIRRLAGLGDETLSTKVGNAVRSRCTWLTINLATAIAASIVIGLFDATIEQMVALAVLMPIVASMGGNAGTQTMTVAVRALAAQDMDNFNAKRIILREMMVGLINGVIFAFMVGGVAYVWFQSLDLGFVIAISMVANMFAAGLAGILIPIGLSKLKIDPAIASSTFVTTVTDVVGFFSFLWLAGWWFGLA